MRLQHKLEEGGAGSNGAKGSWDVRGKYETY
jgi:hypothetical protein